MGRIFPLVPWAAVVVTDLNAVRIERGCSSVPHR